MENELLNLKELQVSIKFNQKGTMLAQVELRYGSLRIFGYRVMESTYSDDGLYIQPPSVHIGSHWLALVRIDDPSLWEALQNLIKNKYLEEVKAHNETITGDIERGIITHEEESELTEELPF